MLFPYAVAAIAILLVAVFAAVAFLKRRISRAEAMPVGPRKTKALSFGSLAIVPAAILLLGAGAAGVVFQVGIKAAQGTPTEDSPVTVRGGSIRIPNASCSSALCSISVGEDADLFSVDGVDLIDSGDGHDKNTPRLISLDEKQNWIVTLSFRDSSGKMEDKNPSYLTVCTKDTTCSGTGGNVKQTIYILGNQYGSFSPYKDRDRDGYRYDLCDCNGSRGLQSPCNHIFAVTVKTANNGKNGDRYHCVDGDCLISVGAPLAAQSLMKLLFSPQGHRAR
ncbi:MAG: hypothetical protein WA294_13585 [Acidobacteriaceae bacterium]